MRGILSRDKGRWENGLRLTVDMLIKRVLAAVQAPPPWLWFTARGVCIRLGPAHRQRFPLEVIQQLHWWLLRPIRQRARRWISRSIPKGLLWKACWLNTYRPAEVAWWMAAGVQTWRQLSCQVPDSRSGAVHAKQRIAWPEHCGPALRLLAHKAELLAASPEQWQAPLLLLDGRPAAAPLWWEQALCGPGIVLKPVSGHGGRAVVRFRWGADGLSQQPLFRQLGGDPPVYPHPDRPTPGQLLEHWQHLCHCRDAAMAAPYLEQSSELPPTDPAVVVRVISHRNTPTGAVSVWQAWLEIPLEGGRVAFVNLAGQLLPMPGQTLTAEQQQQLDGWLTLLRQQGVPPCVEACVAAAEAMHLLLPPIDRVAWDWIPADPQPVLLEGNGGFGLLVPQLLAALDQGPP